MYKEINIEDCKKFFSRAFDFLPLIHYEVFPVVDSHTLLPDFESQSIDPLAVGR